MRQWLFNLFFGTDEIAKRMFQLFTLRKLAISRHEDNKRLRSELTTGEIDLVDLKNQYVDNKDALEKAYQLVLD